LKAFVWTASGQESRLLGTVGFLPESLTLDQSAKTEIARIAKVYSGTDRLVIVGTGFKAGGREWNVAIGQYIAVETKKALASSGVPEGAVETYSHGKEFLVGFDPALASLSYPDRQASVSAGIANGRQEGSARSREQELEQRLAAQVAEAEAAKRRQQELEAQLAAVQSTAQPNPSTGASVIRTAHALVIGNAAYPGSARLDNPVNDANAMSQKLRSMGFTVTTVTDANRQRLVQAMAQFRRSAASADLSLLFYSGHGVQIFGTNYILPTDVDQTDTAQATIQGVRLNEVIENFMPGKTKIVFLDACRDNPLQRTGDRSVTKGLAPISVAEGTLISYATKDGQVAADGVGSKNSPFTQALLEHLADPQDIGVVLRKVREKVMRATGGKQQPWDYGSLTGGELVLSRVRATER
jgi:hypothetical protein